MVVKLPKQATTKKDEVAIWFLLKTLKLVVLKANQAQFKADSDRFRIHQPALAHKTKPI